MKTFPSHSGAKRLPEEDSAYCLFLNLKNEDPKAILNLKARIHPFIQTHSMSGDLSPEDLEEIVNDTVLTCLRKIQDGTCRFMDCDPAVYAISVARRLIANHRRRHLLRCEGLEEYHGLSETDPHQYCEQKEQKRILHEWLAQLGDTGAKIIRYHYLEGLRDEEVVRRQLTPYTTVNSLKTKRSQYMKKLVGLARQV